MAATFQALEVALQLIVAVRPLIPAIAKHDPDLAKQLRKACTSVPSCFSEGAQRRGRDRQHLYRVSGGSAAEVHTQLAIAVAWGYVGQSAVSPAQQLADRCVALAYRLTSPR